jgi:hypothetical protein
VIKDWEIEQYEYRFPVIKYIQRTTVQTPTSNRFGKVLTPENTSYSSTQVDINADFNFDRKRYKFEGGTRIEVQDIEVTLCTPQLEKLGINPQEGDLLKIGDDRYIILRVTTKDLIPSTTQPLHTVCIIDRQHMVKE